MIPQFPFLGKKRTLNDVKMADLMDFQQDLQVIMSDSDKKGKDKQLEIGKKLAQFIKDFDPKEMEDAKPGDQAVLQQLNIIYTLAETKHSDLEMEQLIDDIKKASVKGQLDFLAHPSAFQRPAGN